MITLKNYQKIVHVHQNVTVTEDVADNPTHDLRNLAIYVAGGGAASKGQDNI